MPGWCWDSAAFGFAGRILGISIDEPVEWIRSRVSGLAGRREREAGNAAGVLGGATSWPMLTTARQGTVL